MYSNSFDILFRYLPLRISEAVHSLPEEIFASASEVRLRKNAPVSLTSGNKNIIFDEKGRTCGISSAIRATEEDIRDCVGRLTNGSLYTCDKFLAQGFIPLPEGGRAGICGRVNLRNGRIEGFSEIFSVNLRLHRFLPDVALPLAGRFADEGFCGCLVCSPPGLGKTTFLRSISYLLSTGKITAPRRIGIADERCEISAGLPETGLADIISGAPKAEAITMLTRTMAPQIIICDEISAEETQPVLEAQNTGVHLIASAHCRNPAELVKRGRMKILLESGIFPLCAVLGYDNGYFCNISKTEVFL